MDTIECITTRRSIRQFGAQLVTENDITALIEAAAYAPSWKNSQTTRYIAVFDKALKTQIADTCVLGHASNQRIIKQAPALIVLVTLEGRSGYNQDGSFSTTKGTHWQSFDAGIAAQTFCLAAHARGFGTLIMGLYDQELVGQALSLPEGQSVSALVAIGYPAISPEPPKRKSAAELVTFR